MLHSCMKKHVFLFILVLLIILPVVHGARLYGAIYDQQVNPVRNVVVEVNSTPNQRHISRYGGYSFELERGSYTISAYLTQNQVTRLIAEEEVVITGDGEYLVDLFVFSDLDLEEDFVPRPWYFVAVLILIPILLVLALMYGVYTYRKKNSTGESVQYNIQYTPEYEHSDHEEKPEKINVSYESDDAKLERKILSILSEAEGQLTQKDIRKKIPLSEAKISHVLSALEKKKKIKKVKQGRINIVVLR